MSLSASSILWYRPTVGDALPLGRKVTACLASPWLCASQTIVVSPTTDLLAFMGRQVPQSDSSTCKEKVKEVDLYSASTRSVSKALTHCQGITQSFTCTYCVHPQAERAAIPLITHFLVSVVYRDSRVYCTFNNAFLIAGYINNKNLCGRDGRTICGPQCVPKSTCVSL